MRQAMPNGRKATRTSAGRHETRGRNLREKNVISVMPLRQACCGALPEKKFAGGSKKKDG